MLADLEWANSRKHINQTFMNHRSSRSHTIMTFNVKVATQVVVGSGAEAEAEKGGVAAPGQFNILKSSRSVFIDLAGSERQMYNKDELLAEGCFINKSLSILNHVITSLSSAKKREFVHYRDSK